MLGFCSLSKRVCTHAYSEKIMKGMSTEMASKIKLKNRKIQTIEEVFALFVISRTADGVSETTLKTYHNHFHTISLYLDVQQPLTDLTKSDLEAMIVSMKKSGLAHNSVSSYARVFRSFLNWCKEEGHCQVEMPKISDKEVVKETYTDAELMLLLKKPDKDCTFNEYRTWVIINLLLNNGCRAASIRCIQIQDVDLENRQIILRHTKNGKMQAIPLCSVLIPILREYLATRGGSPSDFLFCTQYGDQLGRDTLRNSIARYNRSRGVEKTSTHLFRHTFARKYLVDCGGDAFALQRLLGHSSLKMTKHYCAIYDSDLAENYDNFSPMAKMKKPKERIKRR